MNHSNSAQTLATVTADVLRTTAFAFAEPCQAQSLPSLEGPAWLARILFNGSTSGSVHLAASQQLCAMVAADVLSEDASDLSAEKAQDTVKEILNMICGQWLTELYGTVPVFGLCVPSLHEISVQEWEALRDAPDTTALMVDEHSLLLAARTQERSP